MIPTELRFEDDAMERLYAGIEKMAKAVKSTMGANGRTAFIESEHHTFGRTITKDGVTVARAINLDDPIENLAVSVLKEAATRTADSAGDGTTSCIVLAEALVKVGMEYMKENDATRTEFVRGMNRVIAEVLDNLSELSKPVKGNDILDVATISANNDAEIGKLIRDVYKKVGVNGIVKIDHSMDDKTYYEHVDGIKIDRGYTSNLFVNEREKDECVMEDVYVLMTDIDIPNLLAIENVLKKVVSERKSLLIIAECNANVINTLGANVVKNGLKLCNIVPPQFGYKRKDLMDDIALSIGGKFFSESFGDDLSLISFEDLGFAKKVIVGKDETVIIKEDCDCDDMKQKIQERVDELKAQMENKSSNKEFLEERIASLMGGVGVIYVGGNSDVEQKEKYDRVEDAVKAVRAALDDGISAGGGIALLEQAVMLVGGEGSDDLFVHAVAEALKSPFETILRNADIDVKEAMEKVIAEQKFGYGLDVKSGKYGDMIKMGIIDPTNVTKSALKNAASVATQILTTGVTVTLKRAE